jgi:pilus assembly protein FimV
MLFPALGAISALGGGYALYAIRRRRRVERFEDSLIAADALEPNSLFGATGGQSVDTRQVTDALAGPASQTATTEVDPVEEANVYVAYGREAQAEDILREGLRKEPARQAIRHRLLELYAGRPDRAAFESLAREMLSMTGPQGDDWARVAQLGVSIDPDNPLYADRSMQRPAATPLALPVVASAAASIPTLGAASAELNADGGVALSDLQAPGSTDARPLPDLEFPQEAAPQARSETEIVITPPSESQSLPEGHLPPLDLAQDLDLDPPTAFADSSFSLPPEGQVDSVQASEDLRARVPNLPDALDLDLDLAALEEISRIQVPTLLPRTGPLPADLGLDLDLENALNAPTDIAFGPTETETSRWQEMATKLDLAIAYREIGDDEGARELLQEVIAGGDPEQQDKARGLLAELA